MLFILICYSFWKFCVLKPKKYELYRLGFPNDDVNASFLNSSNSSLLCPSPIACGLSFDVDCFSVKLVLLKINVGYRWILILKYIRLNYVGRNCLCNICFKSNKKNHFTDI